MAEYIIGLDAGTSVVKAAIFDTNGNEIARGARSVPITNPQAHLAEESMDEVWVAGTEAIAQALTNSSVRADEIIALSATGQGDGTWLIGADGKPKGPAYLWTDGRAGGIIDGWYADGTVSKQFNISGTGPYAGTTSALLRWRQDNEPEILEGATNLWCKDWIEYNLTGDASTDASDASLAGIDVRNRRWSDEVNAAWGFDDRTKGVLPPIKSPVDQIGTVTAHAAGVTGLAEGTPVFKGQMDITASSLGVGVARPGDCMAVIGTAGIVTVATDNLGEEILPTDVGWVIPHSPDTWIRALGMNCCTPNLDWFLREFGDVLRQVVGAVGDWVVVEHAGERRRIKHGRCMRLVFTPIALVDIGRQHHQTLAAGILRRLRHVHCLARAERGDGCHHWRAIAHSLHVGLPKRHPLGKGHGIALAQ